MANRHRERMQIPAYESGYNAGLKAGRADERRKVIEELAREAEENEYWIAIDSNAPGEGHYGLEMAADWLRSHTGDG